MEPGQIFRHYLIEERNAPVKWSDELGKEKSNAQLISAVLNGQREAYAPLFDRYRFELMAYCRKQLGRREGAADIVQETFLRGYLRLSSLEDPELFGAWLKGIAFRVCQESYRADKHSHMSPADPSKTGSTVEEAAVVPDDEDDEAYIEQS